jgi:hypothetical protein
VKIGKPIFAKLKKTRLDQFFHFAKNRSVGIKKQILANFENSKIRKPSEMC